MVKTRAGAAITAARAACRKVGDCQVRFARKGPSSRWRSAARRPCRSTPARNWPAPPGYRRSAAAPRCRRPPDATGRSRAGGRHPPPSRRSRAECADAPQRCPTGRLRPAPSAAAAAAAAGARRPVGRCLLQQIAQSDQAPNNWSAVSSRIRICEDRRLAGPAPAQRVQHDRACGLDRVADPAPVDAGMRRPGRVIGSPVAQQRRQIAHQRGERVIHLRHRLPPGTEGMQPPDHQGQQRRPQRTRAKGRPTAGLGQAQSRRSSARIMTVRAACPVAAAPGR